jgi:hypothetical protein
MRKQSVVEEAISTHVDIVTDGCTQFIESIFG